MAVDARRTETAGGLGFLRQLFAERPAAPATLDDPLGDATLLALRRHGIRPTPESFTLWYRHLAGERPDLSRRLKELEARGEPFDAGLIGVLHERYFGADQAALLVAEASRNALRLLARLESDLAGAEADAAARAERVGRLGRKLEGAPGEAKDGAASAASAEVHARYGEIRARVAELARETEGMRVAAGRLQRRVVEGAAEITQLRAALGASEGADEVDPVSGVARQRRLERALERAVAAAEAADRPLVYMIVDLDRFAAFNEACGRRLGDLMLRAVARRIGLALKRQDTIGRLDGAAFGVVLVDTGLDDATALAERLCRDIADLTLESGETGAAIPAVTVAIGVALSHPGEPLQRLVGRADRARRQARDAGGNRALSERSIAVVGRPKA
ncbi:MAG: GGDEF domain-containing protein [Geminicoccaceae bacterium]|jgi:diguanylate cyclase|nr:GGDEF domain-containing protein [Geminicoccaceae bacterium]HRY24710.1 GGDEF domain-containing protein [Geminicoccaceae bacterium]